MKIVNYKTNKNTPSISDQALRAGYIFNAFFHNSKANPSSLAETLSMIDTRGWEDVMLACRLNSHFYAASSSSISSSSLSFERISRLIDAGGKRLVLKGDKDGNSALHHAYKSCEPSYEIISKLIDIGGRELVMQRGECGDSLLHLALGSLYQSPNSLRSSSSFSSLLELTSRLIDIGGRELVLQECSLKTSTLFTALSSEVPVDLISRLIDIGGADSLMTTTLMAEDGNHPTFLHWLLLVTTGSRTRQLNLLKVFISAGIRHQIGGEFGIGGLFNSCMDRNGDVQHHHHSQIRIYNDEDKRTWDSLILPALLEEDTKLLLNDQPILHAAIMSKAPSNAIRDITTHFSDCISLQDSSGRYPIDVAIEEGLKWEEGLRMITNETLATQQERTIINVAAQHGLEWDNGMKEVVEENLNDVGTVDELTGFYPFMLAATGELQSSSSLNSIFNLMRKEPTLVRLYGG